MHDQSLADWEEAVPNASLVHSDFVPLAAANTPPDPSDLAWRVYLGWNNESQRVLVGLERIDDDYWPPAEGGVEANFLYVDGDHSGGQFAASPDTPSDNTEQEYASAQRYTFGVEPMFLPDESPVRVAETSAHWAAQEPWTEFHGFQVGDTPNVSIIEMAIVPWDKMVDDGPSSSRRTVLRPGSVIGFNVEIWDFDEVDRTRKAYALSPASQFASVVRFDADDFVDGELVPCFVSDCSRGDASIVVQDTWARVKVSLSR